MSARHYDNPLRISYGRGHEIDFGAGAEAWAIKVPPGVTMCQIEEIHVQVTETFNQTTLQGFVRIGTAGDADAFAELGMGVAANTDGWGIRDFDAAVAANGGTPPTLKDNSYGGSGVINVGPEGADIDQLEVSTSAPTGGIPAGKGYLSISLAWW